jgi:hypothetical protein
MPPGKRFGGKLRADGSNADLNATAELLLLPDEYCVAEDRDTVLVELFCEREGFTIFGQGDVSRYIEAKAYLTNYRVVSTKFV